MSGRSWGGQQSPNQPEQPAPSAQPAYQVPQQQAYGQPQYPMQQPPPQVVYVQQKPPRKWFGKLMFVLIALVVIGMWNTPASKQLRSDIVAAGQGTPPAQQPQVNKPAESAQPAKPAGPQQWTDGTYEVGVDIAPGRYKVVPAEGGIGMCYWSTLKDTTGQFGSIVANDVAKGPSYFEVASGSAVKYVQLRGCVATKA